MPLTLACAKCGQKLAIADELRGKQVQCPKCLEVYLVEKKRPNQPSEPDKPVESKRSASLRSPQKPSPSGGMAGPSAAKAEPPEAKSDPKDPSIAICAHCDKKMRLPVAPGITTFLCPHCSQSMRIRPPQVEIPATSAIEDDDPFADLPVTVPLVRTPVPPGPMRSSPRSVTPRPIRPGDSASTRRSPRGGYSPSVVGPGWLIVVPYTLVALGTIALLFVVVRNREDVRNPRDFNVLLILYGGFLVHYFVVIAGGVRMILGAPKWISITTCVLALIPTVFFGAMCLGGIAYPFVLAGSVWGLIAISFAPGSQANTPAWAETDSRTLSPAEQYLRSAMNEGTSAGQFNAAALVFSLIGILALCPFFLYGVATGLGAVYLLATDPRDKAAYLTGVLLGGLTVTAVTGLLAALLIRVVIGQLQRRS